MFDLGIQELIVIFIVALLVFGPKKLPELAANLGKVAKDIREAISGVKEQIDSEIREIKDPIALKNDIYKDSDLFKNEYKKTKEESAHKKEEQEKTPSNQNELDLSAESKSKSTTDDKR